MRSDLEVESTISSILLVDIGNTNLKWCRLEANEITKIQSTPHQERNFPEVAFGCWRESLVPSAILVANVAGNVVREALHEWVRKNWAIVPSFVEPESSGYGVTSGYRYPKQLGVDRWLTMIAVHDQLDSAACIVDCGTAITIDVIQANGLHLGGLILPGIGLMRDALLKRTSIPRVSASSGVQLLGTDTETAVASASIHAAAALIERVVERCTDKLGEIPVLLLTGSDAPQMDAALSLNSQTQPDLVMAGLALIARESMP